MHAGGSTHARATEACANAGSLDEALTISMEIELILYEAGRLQDAASLLNRILRSLSRWATGYGELKWPS
jgi:hypothetical protein